jgi:hypothetical protein
MRWLVILLVSSGCATGSVARHAASQPYVIDAVEIAGVRDSPLTASRESYRVEPGQDSVELRDVFVRELGQRIPFSTTAPQHLRVVITLQDTGENEGLAAETSDVTVVADVLDAGGATFRSITLREPASAPLQRTRSARIRLERALSSLADRLASQL